MQAKTLSSASTEIGLKKDSQGWTDRQYIQKIAGMNRQTMDQSACWWEK